jgi:hypothetical protein
MPSKRSFARWFSWDAWETNKLRKDLAEQQAPKGRYQRLPDGTWGYPPEQPAQTEAQAAYQQGWRDGWAAGWAASAEAARQAPPQSP